MKDRDRKRRDSARRWAEGDRDAMLAAAEEAAARANHPSGGIPMVPLAGQLPGGDRLILAAAEIIPDRWKHSDGSPADCAVVVRFLAGGVLIAMAAGDCWPLPDPADAAAEVAEEDEGGGG